MLEYASNASKLHKDFGDMLVSSGYGTLTIKQEVPVKELCPDYPNGKDRFDYYIRELNVVVELHGQQHYKPVTFGGVSENKAVQNYIRRVTKDSDKAIAAIQAGYFFIHFAYNETIDQDTFHSKLKAATEITLENEVEDVNIVDTQQQAWKERIRKQNKEYRKALYKKMKEERSAIEK